MQINATFIVQLINFFITYHVLNFLVFKPIIASLHHKEKEEKKINDSIAHEEEILLSLEKEKSQAMRTFQTQTKEKYPYVSLVEKEKEEEFKIPKTEIDQTALEKQVTDFLIEKVPHEY